MEPETAAPEGPKLQLTAAQKLEAELLAEQAKIIYATSNARVGSTAHMLAPKGPFNKSNKFSDGLAKAGNYANNGLNTTVPVNKSEGK